MFGASASGKSLLLKALSGRIQSLAITGSVFLNGVSVDPTVTSNSTCYVPQDSMLIGDLTAREMVFNSASIKRRSPLTVIEKKVSNILEEFGLSHVADNYIGTIFRRYKNSMVVK